MSFMDTSKSLKLSLNHFQCFTKTGWSSKRYCLTCFVVPRQSRIYLSFHTSKSLELLVIAPEEFKEELGVETSFTKHRLSL